MPGGPQVIGEGEGAKLLHYWRFSSRDSHVPVNLYSYVVEGAGGNFFILEESNGGHFHSTLARMNNAGDVAITTNKGLSIFFAPDYEPVTILKLRTNRFLKAEPDIKGFRIEDVSWEKGMVVCMGRLLVPGKPTKRYPTTVAYPFLSRFFFDARGDVSDHQVLWTTWNPGRPLPEHAREEENQDPAAMGIEYGLHLRSGLALSSITNRLHVQGRLVLWKNVGHHDRTPYPDDSPKDYEKSAWRCTDLTTGATREIAASDKIDRPRLEQIDQANLDQFKRAGLKP